MRRNIFFTNAQKYLFHQCAQMMIHKFAQIFPHEKNKQQCSTIDANNNK